MWLSPLGPRECYGQSGTSIRDGLERNKRVASMVGYNPMVMESQSCSNKLHINELLQLAP